MNDNPMKGVERRLDLLIALARVAHAPALEAHRSAIEADPVAVALLDNSHDWVRAGDLQRQAIKASKQSLPTVQRRMKSLVASGSLERRGAGNRVEYRNTGLFSL